MNGRKIEKQPKRQHKELCHLIYTLATAVGVNEFSTQNREMVAFFSFLFFAKLVVMSEATVITGKPFATFNYSKRDLFICPSFA